ncbi:DUF484 family protein [Falsigemmobacter intermedius]|uniref:DUF484 family protein n=1 Tax=Falsigemmobacter intermedius TaxID=1553448 RepID=UPI003EFC2A05
MSEQKPLSGGSRLTDDLRDELLSRPELVLADKDVMRALVGAHERSLGGNVIDLRGAAMKRLEGRLDQLEATHRSVIAAAYENLAGTNLIHRAVLEVLEPTDFGEFLRRLETRVAETLRLDSLRLVLEARGRDPVVERHSGLIHVVEPGFIGEYLNELTEYRAPVTLRGVIDGAGEVHGREEGHIRSEAVLALDLGAGRLPGMLVMGSAEEEQFAPRQGTDLLRFFGAVFSLTLRRWLA